MQESKNTSDKQKAKRKRRAFTQRERANLNRARINKLKKKPCKRCRKSYPPCAMDFDHVRGKKSFGIGQRGTTYRSWNAIQKEIAKCDLLCANCHRIRTHLRRKK